MFATYTVLFFLQSTTLLVLFCFPSLCLSQETNTNFTIISTLRDPNTISSSNQVFQLGFFSPPNTTNRYLAIYYTFSPETIIWIPNRERPLNDSSGHLSIASDGNLVLTNRWNETVWSTNITRSSLRNNTSAQLQDTGNLVLKDISTGTIWWESFSQPLNVLVPTMKMTYNTNTHTNVSLSTWKSPSNPGVGNFTAGVEALQTTQLIHRRQNGQPYWRSGPWNGRFFSGVETMYSPFLQAPRGQGGQMLDPQGLAVPQIHDQNGSVYFVVPEGLFWTRLLLNSSGHSIYSAWNDQERDWTVISITPQRECDVYGICGPFSSCNRFNSPICSCLTGFQPENPEEWNQGNWTGGCVRQRQLECSLNNNTSGNEDRFFRLPFVKVPDFAIAVPSIQPDECRRMCLGNCSCIAYAHEPYIGCMLWQDSLIDVMAMAGVGIDMYIRLSASESDNPENRRLVIIITVAVIGGFAIICISILTVWCWMVKRKGSKLKDRRQTSPTNSKAKVLEDDETENVNIEEMQFFTFNTLAKATQQFDDSNLLGTGGFGPVYKGTLQNGKTVAVKRLSAASKQGNEEFMNEVVVISKLQHRNLVRLLGCCVENEDKLLIYEYMPNKSLDGCLFGHTHASMLDWKKRTSIIGGIGRGLLYLHKDSRLKIIHRDLKPSNVLLDEDWNPKISDFGMARIFGKEEEHDNTTRVVGTFGYMAPEYAMEGQYSEKSDIYSFGVLMLEILSGKKNTHYYNPELSSLSLIGCAWKMWHENKGLLFADRAIASLTVQGDISRCINIALLCVQEFPNDRPSIETVLSMLSKEIIDLPAPEEPFYLEKWNTSHFGTTNTLSQLGHSVNELTITMIDGR